MKRSRAIMLIAFILLTPKAFGQANVKSADGVAELCDGRDECQFDLSKWGNLAWLEMGISRSTSSGAVASTAADVAVFLERNPVLTGLSNQSEELYLERELRLPSGATLYRYRQYWNGIRVYSSDFVLMTSAAGDIVGVWSSLVPTAVLDSSSGLHDFGSNAEGCMESLESVIGDLTSTIDIVYSPSMFGEVDTSFRIGMLVASDGRDGRPLQGIIDRASCSAMSITELEDRLYHGVGYRYDGYQIPDCVVSTFPCDEGSCEFNGWPDPPGDNENSRRLYDKIQLITERTSQYYQWDEWYACRDNDGIVYYEAYLTGGLFGMAETARGGGGLISFCQFGGYYYIRHLRIGPNANCVDIVGHEATHGILHIIGALLGLTSAFSDSLTEEFGDSIGEMYQTEPDWLMRHDSGDSDNGCNDIIPLRSFEYPLNPGIQEDYNRVDSYRWYRTGPVAGECDYYDPHHNIGIVSRMAFGLGSTGSKTWYGVTFQPIGLDNTRDLFWDVLVANPAEQTYEGIYSLMKSTAATLFGTLSNEYQSVIKALEAVGIWKPSSTIIVPSGGGFQLVSSSVTPAAVERVEGSPIGINYRYLFYLPNASSPTVPTDIYYTKGTVSQWSSPVAVQLGSNERTVNRIDAALCGTDICVLYRPYGYLDLHYFKIGSSGTISGPFGTSVVTSTGEGKISAAPGGFIISYVSTAGASRYKYIPTQGASVAGNGPGKSCGNKPATFLYDTTSGYMWSFLTNCDGSVDTSRASWSCLAAGQVGCWATGAHVPAPFCDQNYLPTPVSSPAAAIFNNELHVTTTYGGPFGEPTIWTDSCHDFRTGGCQVSLDIGLPNGDNGGSWNNIVPRNILTTDPGEFLNYSGRLYLYAVGPDHYVRETSARAP